MQYFARTVDRLWDAVASVKLTLVIFLALLLLSIPGTVVLQYNMSNVDPGIQYGYQFWNIGSNLQLFTAYHSFWYVGLLVILSLNLITCSVNRWPQMLKLAIAKPVKWARSTFERQPEPFRFSWKTNLSKEEVERRVIRFASSPFSATPKILHSEDSKVQIFWQSGQWSRISNYLVHTSLLVIFAGAIITALYGFEGAANIPTGAAVDTVIIFKEGKYSGLVNAPGGLINEKLLGFRIRVKDFKVNFYKDFPGRPESFISRIQLLKDGVPVKEKSIRVNDPIEYQGVRMYQASYGPLGDAEIQLRVIDKKNPTEGQAFRKARLGETIKLDPWHEELVALQAVQNVQGFGPGIQLQKLKDGKPAGAPFWLLKDHPNFDFVSRADSSYGLVLDEVEELYFSGLQIGYDPGAPIYWWGCFGMLLGTFYALFVTHKKYYFNFENGQIDFAGSIHRLPFGFEAALSKKAEALKSLLKENKNEVI